MGTDEKLVPGKFLMPGTMSKSAECLAAEVNEFKQTQRSASEMTNVTVNNKQNEEIGQCLN